MIKFNNNYIIFRVICIKIRNYFYFISQAFFILVLAHTIFSVYFLSILIDKTRSLSDKTYFFKL